LKCGTNLRGTCFILRAAGAFTVFGVTMNTLCCPGFLLPQGEAVRVPVNLAPATPLPAPPATG
jgi:hypothetical protein